MNDEWLDERLSWTDWAYVAWSWGFMALIGLLGPIGMSAVLVYLTVTDPPRHAGDVAFTGVSGAFLLGLVWLYAASIRSVLRN